MAFLLLCVALLAPDISDQVAFPGGEWESCDPVVEGLDPAPLQDVARLLGGRGCVVKSGRMVMTWGDQSERGDWMSAAKPVLSTLLFFAVHEGLVSSPDQPIADFGWDLNEKDRLITFRHLGSMTSGFRRPEPPGTAWAYNDPAIQLYQMTLFDRVFREDPVNVSGNPDRLGTLGFQDALLWTDGKRRLKASVRDLARIAWFWACKGRWADRQLIPESLFTQLLAPQTPADLPHTTGEESDDYLGIGSYGGSSDHFTDFGAGVYGFNFWFNGKGRLHPDTTLWPDAPSDTFMAIGAGGNCAAVIPSLGLVVVCAKGNWGKLEAGNREAAMNRVLALAVDACQAKPASVSGDMVKWRPVTVDFQGPRSNSVDINPNPFLDYRLQVLFTAPSGAVHNVPGFFAGDGLGGGTGTVWQVVLSPDEIGEWRYQASFRVGEAIAVSTDPDAGEVAAFDGATGRFHVGAQDETARGFYLTGRLEYVGGHYLKCRDGGYWIKGGTNSPEDYLAYVGFDGTPRATHSYAGHVADWREDDPDWGDGRGKGIIGSLNYLASAGVNSVYFLPMNIGGDGKNVHPWLEPIDPQGHPDNDNLHFDQAKLRQWGIVFEHAQNQGIMLHFVLSEAEESNKRELDDGLFGVERKLYYRELVARFSHFPAVQWNLCEEYNIKFVWEPAMIRAIAQYFRDIDPYAHPVTVHHARTPARAWQPFLGDPLFSVTSFQTHENVSEVVENWRILSSESGHPLVIGMDEFFPDKAGPDTADRHRREYLWPVLLSGGNIEFILEDLLKTDDFRKYEALWTAMRIARTFMEMHLPFWEMIPSDELLDGESMYQGKHSLVGGQVLAKEDECYAVYLPSATETGNLDLARASGMLTMRWYNPREGVFEGEVVPVRGGDRFILGTPPGDRETDWVVLIKHE